MLDTRRQVEVPEGITLSLPVAGVVSRSLAFLIDLLIRFGIIYVIAQIAALMGNFGDGLIYITIFLVEWFYPVLLEVFYNGQTFGKKTMGIMVINDDGTPINWSSSIVRNLMRFADFLPFFYGFGVLSMLYSRDFKRLGDFAAGTLVVHKLDQIEKTQSLDVEALAPKTPLTLDEQRAIIGFSERTTKMSSSRTHELANILQPWLDSGDSKSNDKSKRETAANKLARIAKWLRGDS